MHLPMPIFFHGVIIDPLFAEYVGIFKIVGSNQEPVDVKHGSCFVHDHDAQ
jgi:hypothetical protein